MLLSASGCYFCDPQSILLYKQVFSAILGPSEPKYNSSDAKKKKNCKAH